MKNLEFLKPVFSLGMLIVLAFLLIANLFIFKYVSNGLSAIWFVLVEELAVLFGYVIARSLKNPDEVIWGFAKKWWEDSPEGI